MGLKYQATPKGQHTLCLKIKDESMSVIYSINDKNLITGMGDFLCYVMNKLGIPLTEVIRQEIRAELKTLYAVRDQKVNSVLKEMGQYGKDQ